jgi:hypothetical protein
MGKDTLTSVTYEMKQICSASKTGHAHEFQESDNIWLYYS